MGANPTESDRMARIHELDLEYQHAIHQTTQINRDEEARRLKLRVLSLRDENAMIKDRLSQKDARIASATKMGDNIRFELDDANTAARSQDARLKKQTMEMNNLKTEIRALNDTMQDSGKALQEKFALTRELARLRPEMEHLQSQVTNHQAVVAEKHDLRRQLDSLEVELENERRSKQRARSKDDHEAMDDLRTRLEATEKRLAAEKREREEAKKEHEKALAEASDRSERLEERAQTLKTKLKGAQVDAKEALAELEKCRADLEAAKASSRRISVDPRAKKTIAIKTEPVRKRRVEDISLEDISIQFPGNDDMASRRPTKKRAGVGEKSTFSITPFLNRTKSLSDESAEIALPTAIPADASLQATGNQAGKSEPEPNSDADDPQDEEAFPEFHDETVAAEAPKKPKSRGRPKTKVQIEVPEPKKKAAVAKQAAFLKADSEATLTEVSASKKNTSAAWNENAPMQEAELEAGVEHPVEEGSLRDQENAPMATKPRKRVDLAAKVVPRRNTINTGPTDTELKKRKRKLLGASKIVLDDEDGEAAEGPVKPSGGQTRRVKSSLGGVANAFAGASFSPLKRDRRGVHASFLV